MHPCAPPQQYTEEVSYTDWATGKHVPTTTSGVVQAVKLSPGATVTLAFSAAASRDPGVFPADPAAAVVERLAGCVQAVCACVCGGVVTHLHLLSVVYVYLILRVFSVVVRALVVICECVNYRA